MKQRMVISNIRMPETDWLQVKAAAGDLGMSVNQYLNFVVERCTLTRSLAKKPQEIKLKHVSLWDLPMLVKNIKNKSMGLSKEDEEIYSL